MEGLLAETMGLLAQFGAAAPEGGNQLSAVDPLLILAIVLIGGVLGGQAARALHIPAITGNIVAGTILGMTLLRGVNVAEALQPLSSFAIGLIAVTAGGYFSYRRIHNALRRIVFVSVLEVVGAVLLCYIAMVMMGLHWTAALILGALAASSAPATTVALIQENRAKGPAVKTLLASVTMDSSLCILLFAFFEGLVVAHFAASTPGELGLLQGFQRIVWQLFGSAVLGLVLGGVANWITGHSRFHGFSFMLIAILVAIGISSYLEFSPLLTCLFFGVYMGNSLKRNEQQLEALRPIEPMLYTAFFTLAGVSLHLELLLGGGAVFVVYLLARAIGKGFGAWLGAVLSGASERIRRSLPYAFVPQAGVAPGLIVILQSDARIPEEFSSFVVTLVLASITVNEIVGPFLTRFSLKRAQEAGLDRPRLVEFLQEEFVLVGLEAEDKWEALEKLVEFHSLTHRISSRRRNLILDTVREREEDHSTLIDGMEAALPHGWIDSGAEIQGVLGVAPDGIEWDAEGGEKVKLIVLIVTPKDQAHRHLEVLATLSGIISNERIRTRLVSATDANDAWEVLESKESRDLNYFLEDDETNGQSPVAH